MTIKSRLLGPALAVLACFATTPALASTLVTVEALANSSSGGAGAAAISLTSGQAFTVSVDPNDLWNAGALPRWSNADGLIVDLYATGTDESGYAAGTHIGEPFPLWTQDGLSAPYGSLVGRIGSGAYFLIGTNFTGVADATGLLQFYYWDSNSADNTELIEAITVAVNVPPVTAVPLPGALPLFASGLGALGFAGWRRRKARAV
jgi:hypothetical protein